MKERESEGKESEAGMGAWQASAEAFNDSWTHAGDISGPVCVKSLNAF